jgi:hypothetical protein
VIRQIQDRIRIGRSIVLDLKVKIGVQVEHTLISLSLVSV